ncbi:MAG TPA: efflux RND transporter periplasmic adaptor subunit [Pseudogracilibacillus sp.]|nr:efflux RND transporter periplasmic adaptor subunit [Pseudogracilibacillus sp.]
MRKMLFLCLLTIMLLVVAACGETDDESTSSEDSVTPVEIAQVSKGDLTTEQTVFGHVLPNSQTPVLPGQAGEVTDLKVEPGDDVKKDASLATLKTAMGNMTVKAPKAGTVGQLTLNKNDFYNGEDPFAIIFDDEKLLVQFSVTSSMRDKFKVDKTYKTTIDGKEFDAKINRIESLPNEAGQYEITAQIENEDDDALLGAVAELSVKEVLEKDTLFVPTEAIVTDSEETYMFLVEDDKAKKVVVEVLETQTDNTAIEADVKEEAEVIVNGQFLLTDGSKIDVIKEGK